MVFDQTGNGLPGSGAGSYGAAFGVVQGALNQAKQQQPQWWQQQRVQPMFPGASGQGSGTGGGPGSWGLGSGGPNPPRDAGQQQQQAQQSQRQAQGQGTSVGSSTGVPQSQAASQAPAPQQLQMSADMYAGWKAPTQADVQSQIDALNASQKQYDQQAQAAQVQAGQQGLGDQANAIQSSYQAHDAGVQQQIEALRQSVYAPYNAAKQIQGTLQGVSQYFGQDSQAPQQLRERYQNLIDALKPESETQGLSYAQASGSPSASSDYFGKQWGYQQQYDAFAKDYNDWAQAAAKQWPSQAQQANPNAQTMGARDYQMAGGQPPGATLTPDQVQLAQQYGVSPQQFSQAQQYWSQQPGYQGAQMNGSMLQAWASQTGATQQTPVFGFPNGLQVQTVQGPNGAQYIDQATGKPVTADQLSFIRQNQQQAQQLSVWGPNGWQMPSGPPPGRQGAQDSGRGQPAVDILPPGGSGGQGLGQANFQAAQQLSNVQAQIAQLNEGLRNGSVSQSDYQQQMPGLQQQLQTAQLASSQALNALQQGGQVQGQSQSGQDLGAWNLGSGGPAVGPSRDQSGPPQQPQAQGGQNGITNRTDGWRPPAGLLERAQQNFLGLSDADKRTLIQHGYQYVDDGVVAPHLEFGGLPVGWQLDASGKPIVASVTDGSPSQQGQGQPQPQGGGIGIGVTSGPAPRNIAIPSMGARAGKVTTQGTAAQAPVAMIPGFVNNTDPLTGKPITGSGFFDPTQPSAPNSSVGASGQPSGDFWLQQGGTSSVSMQSPFGAQAGQQPSNPANGQVTWQPPFGSLGSGGTQPQQTPVPVNVQQPSGGSGYTGVGGQPIGGGASGGAGPGAGSGGGGASGGGSTVSGGPSGTGGTASSGGGTGSAAWNQGGYAALLAEIQKEIQGNSTPQSYMQARSNVLTDSGVSNLNSIPGSVWSYLHNGMAGNNATPTPQIQSMVGSTGRAATTVSAPAYQNPLASYQAPNAAANITGGASTLTPDQQALNSQLISRLGQGMNEASPMYQSLFGQSENAINQEQQIADENLQERMNSRFGAGGNPGVNTIMAREQAITDRPYIQAKLQASENAAEQAAKFAQSYGSMAQEGLQQQESLGQQAQQERAAAELSQGGLNLQSLQSQLSGGLQAGGQQLTAAGLNQQTWAQQLVNELQRQEAQQGVATSQAQLEQQANEYNAGLAQQYAGQGSQLGQAAMSNISGMSSAELQSLQDMFNVGEARQQALLGALGMQATSGGATMASGGSNISLQGGASAANYTNQQIPPPGKTIYNDSNSAYMSGPNQYAYWTGSQWVDPYSNKAY